MQEFLESFLDLLIWISLISAVVYIVFFVLIIPVIKKRIEVSREEKKEENRLHHEQLNSELFKESPGLYIKLNELVPGELLITLRLAAGLTRDNAFANGIGGDQLY